MSAKEKLDLLESEYLKSVSVQLRDSLARTESPIEQLFLAHFLVNGWRFPTQTEFCDIWKERENFGFTNGLYRSEDFYTTVIYVQPHIDKRYRVDFAIIGERRVVVELDGHDFHERTKEQAKNDKSRDRVLSASGWTVLRFTGSEIFSNASRCATEALAIASPKNFKSVDSIQDYPYIGRK